MSLKITIEVDGKSEQQLAPALNRLANVQGERTPQPFFHENTALMLQQVQQLMKQNQLLQAQVSCQMSKQLPSTGLAAKALRSASGESNRALPVQVMPPENASGSKRPRLPAQYQLSHTQQLMYRAKCCALFLPRQLWQGLVWMAFGKVWLALALLLGSGLLGALHIAPMISKRFPPPRSMATPPASRSPAAQSFKEGPGQTVPSTDTPPGDVDINPPDQTRAQTASPADAQAIDTDLPIPATIGQHPPPPPTFENNSVEYQPR